MPVSSLHPAAFASILAGQFYLRRVPMNFDHGPEWLGETRESFENIPRLITFGRRRQTARLHVDIVVVFVMHVGLAFADLVLPNGCQLDRLQISALKFDIGDDT